MRRLLLIIIVCSPLYSMDSSSPRKHKHKRKQTDSSANQSFGAEQPPAGLSGSYLLRKSNEQQLEQHKRMLAEHAATIVEQQQMIDDLKREVKGHALLLHKIRIFIVGQPECRQRDFADVTESESDE